MDLITVIFSILFLDSFFQVVVGDFHTSMNKTTIEVLGMERGNATTLTRSHNKSEIEIDPVGSLIKSAGTLKIYQWPTVKKCHQFGINQTLSGFCTIVQAFHRDVDMALSNKRCCCHWPLTCLLWLTKCFVPYRFISVR